MSGFPGYKPNSQDANKYGISPIQKWRLNMVNIDRSQGAFFSDLEGEFIYVAQTDYPFLISLVDRSNTIFQTFVAIPGTKIRAPFKGIVVTHPPMPAGVYRQEALMYIGKTKDSDFENSSNTPSSAFYPPYRVTADTAVAGSLQIMIPPGTRFIQEFKIALQATTFTQCKWTFFTIDGVVCGSPNIDLSGPTGGVNFNSSGTAQNYALTNIVGAKGIAVEQNIPVPNAAYLMQIDTIGTGMVLAGASIKAVMSAS